MTYTYTALLYHLDKETIFTFTSLPSGILSIDKNEDEKEAVEEVLMELLFFSLNCSKLIICCNLLSHFRGVRNLTG